MRQVGATLHFVASLVAKHELEGTWASVAAVPGLWSTGSVVVVHVLSCFTACEIFLDQGSIPSPTLTGRFLTTEPLGSPKSHILKVRNIWVLVIWGPREGRSGQWLLYLPLLPGLGRHTSRTAKGGLKWQLRGR